MSKITTWRSLLLPVILFPCTALCAYLYWDAYATRHMFPVTWQDQVRALCEAAKPECSQLTFAFGPMDKKDPEAGVTVGVAASGAAFDAFKSKVVSATPSEHLGYLHFSRLKSSGR